MNRRRIFFAAGVLALIAGVVFLILSGIVSTHSVLTGHAPDQALSSIDPSEISWTRDVTIDAGVHDGSEISFSGAGALGEVTLWLNGKPQTAIAPNDDGIWQLVMPMDVTDGPAEIFVTSKTADGRIVRSSDAIFAIAGDSSTTLMRAGAGDLRAFTLAPPEDVTLLIEAADWNETPEMRIAGRAAPGSLVRLYFGNRMVGEALADGSGRYFLRLIDDSPYGKYALRADSIGQAGAVTARAEVTFMRSAPRRMGSGSRVIVDTVEGATGGAIRILRHEPGSGVRETLFFATLSQARDPAEPRSGQVFSGPLL